MVRLLALVLFAVALMRSSECQTRAINSSQPNLCINATYGIALFSQKSLRMKLDRTRLRQANVHTVTIRASIIDPKVAEFPDHQHSLTQVFHLTDDTPVSQNGSNIVYNIPIHATYMNLTYVDYSIETIQENKEIIQMNCSVLVMVSQPQRLLDKIFLKTIPFVIMFISIQMGILLDLKVLGEIARRPIQVLIGFVCQYGFMPLIAFGISKIFHYQPLYGLGLFVVGCCPGGSASNQWTVIFDGDLNLSVFMSFASTIASFFMMPIWLYTLGQYAYLRELKIRIPFVNLAQSLLTIIGPIGIGMLLVYFVPKVKPIVERIVKPTLLLIIGYFFVFGAFVNYYLFRYMDLRTALTAPFLPWIGFLLGGFFAWICKQDQRRVVTIGIETGIQNVGIAFMVLLYSFPAPENSQATVIPLLVAYLSTQPFYVVLLYRLFRNKCCKPKKVDSDKSLDKLSKTTDPPSEPEEQPLDEKKTTEPTKISVAKLLADAPATDV